MFESVLNVSVSAGLAAFGTTPREPDAREVGGHHTTLSSSCWGGSVERERHCELSAETRLGCEYRKAS